VRLENVHKTYLLGVEGVPALRGVSLSIRRGEFVVIFGLSGGGKTTLLNVIGTIDKPTKGELHLCGHRIDSHTPDHVLSYIRLKKLGFVFQTFNLLSSLTAQENVELPMILAGELEHEEREKRAIDLLKRVGMGERLDHVPSQLSGGEQQRVTIARAVSNRPDILLLDEPTGDLDSVNTCIVMQQLLELNKKENITLVMVTHDVGLKEFADRVIWMSDGKIKNVEVMNRKQQKQRIAKLREDTERILKGEKQPYLLFNHSFIRRPTDYETHPQYDPAKIEKTPVDFSEKYQKLAQISLDDYEDSLLGTKNNKNKDGNGSNDKKHKKKVVHELQGLVEDGSSDALKLSSDEEERHEDGGVRLEIIAGGGQEESSDSS